MLRHPLLVEAVEALFVPVAIYNNVPGEDEKALKSFQEPAWNNPVVRIVDHQRRPLAPRVNKNYTLDGLVQAMMKALKATETEAPAYFRLLADELQARQPQRATFAMHCFWEGEAALGQLEGVLQTRPGFVGNDEVVDVLYDARRVEFAELVETARRLKCASRVYTADQAQLEVARQLVGADAKTFDGKVRPDKEPKYYLEQTPLRFIPMTELQAARVNAALTPVDGKIRISPAALPPLSPEQQKLLAAIREQPNRPWKNVIGSSDLPGDWQRARQLGARSSSDLPGQRSP